MTSLLWPTISELVGTHGPICSRCISSVLALPGPLVTMATLGLSRLGVFEVADGVCGRCRLLGRVIRSCQGSESLKAASFEIQARDDPRDRYYS